MTDNEIIIYGFHLGNSDPDFQRFVRSMSNEDVHNLRKILYESKQIKYKDGYAAAMYGRDRYGFVNIPESIKMKNWEESEKELFPFIKDLWVASVLGFDDPGLNPVKNHQWRTMRLRAVTSHGEGWDAIKSAGLEIGLSYIGAKGLLNPAARQVGQALSKVKIEFPRIRDGNGIFGKKGLVFRNYKLEMMYKYGDGGTIFSIREGVVNRGKFNNLDGGNLFRLDIHSHPKHPLISRLHYHRRWLNNGVVKGSTQPRSIQFKNNK